MKNRLGSSCEPLESLFYISPGVNAWVNRGQDLSYRGPFLVLFHALRRALIGSSRRDKPSDEA